MQPAVRWIDSLLRRQGDIYEFSQAPGIILRLQLTLAPHTVKIGEVAILKGSPVLGLHVWSDRMPQIPAEGADLEWALSLRRQLIHTFNEIAHAIQAGPQYDEVQALFGASALLSTRDHTGGVQMFRRLGFTILPYQGPLGRFGDFWENLFSWWMMGTFNPPSLQTRYFWRLERTEMWITRQDFLVRFGE